MLQGLPHDPAPIFASESEPTTPLPILYEDHRVLVIAKPQPLLSVPGATPKLRDSALLRLQKLHPNILQVHRLDRDTSGVLLWAKDHDAQRLLQRAFEERMVQKRYIAWVLGDVSQEKGRISLPLRVDVNDRPRQIVDFTNGKEAITEYQVLKRESQYTQIAFTPLTGRTHQLRVHAAHPQGLHAPIVGDRLYGKEAERLYLHAESLTFPHPDTREPCTVQNILSLSPPR